MTSVVIAGTLRDAFGVALTNYDIQLVSLRTSETVLNTTTVKTTTSATGAYSFSLQFGTYALRIKANREAQYRTVASNIMVYSTAFNNYTIEQLLNAQVDLSDIDVALIDQMFQVKEGTIAAKNAATIAADSAATSASNATTKATEAATSANTASTKATNAATSANTATTKATEAATSAANAATSANTAATKATEAATSANTATTKATEAATSANTASTSAANAASSANTASTKATEAATSANTASTKATEAANSANTASTKATNAAASANTASTKATEAATSANNAATSANTASTKATEAANSANTASTKATEAATSATSAATSATEAAASASEASKYVATLSGGIFENGNVDLSSGIAPSPMTNGNGNTLSTLWRVTVGGTINGIVYGIGDSIVYSKALGSYYKIDSTDQVSSVNGMTGAVNITDIAGNAGTATTLKTGRNISISGDGTGSKLFNGSTDVSISLTLSNTGVVAGTYTKVQVDSKGRVLSASNPTTLAGYGILDAQALNSILTSISGIATNVTGVLTITNGTASIDSTAYLPSSVYTANDILTKLKTVDGTNSGLDADLLDGMQPTSANTASTVVSRDSSGNFSANIVTANLSGNSSTAAKLQTARTIAISGSYGTGTATSFDGSGNISIPFTLADSGVAAGTYNSSTTAITPITVDAKGRVTGIGTALTITPAWSSVTGKPTTLAGYGILDAQALNSILTSISSVPTNVTGVLTITNGIASIDSTAYLPSSVYTANDILIKLKTVDGAASGLDADLLDGLNSTQFIRSDTNSSITGEITSSSTFTGTQFISTTTGTGQDVKLGGSVWLGDISTANTMRVTGVTDGTKGYIVFGNSNATALGRTGTGPLTYGGNVVWHAGNDGSGSGLDADLLDGYDSNRFSLSAAGNISSGDWNTFTAHGVYKVNHNDFSADTNYPPAVYPLGILHVMVSELTGEQCTMQMYYPHNQDVDKYIYQRMYNAGSWTSWCKIWRGGTDAGSGLVAEKSRQAEKAENTAPIGEGRDLVYGQMGGDDLFRLRIFSDVKDNGQVEIATADGGNEPIYVRQYDGLFSRVRRTLALLDGAGVTRVPIGVDLTGSFGTGISGQVTNGIMNGNADGSNSNANNIRIASWWGVGISPSVSGQAVPQWEYSHWFDARTGNGGMRGTLAQWSDVRLKTDIVTIPDALAKVNALRGVTYTRKDSGERCTGMIAQEVQAVLPEAVTEGSDENKTLSVAYGNTVGLLVEAIKELKAEVDTLRTEVAALKAG